MPTHTVYIIIHMSPWPVRDYIYVCIYMYIIIICPGPAPYCRACPYVIM